MQTPLDLGFMASHGGTSMRAIVAAIEDGRLASRARLLITNNEGSAALEFARSKGIATTVINKLTGSAEAQDQATADAMRAAGVSHIVLSGFLRKLGPLTLASYPHRIMNVHPARLPAFGGKGMYGDFVHQAVLAAGVPMTGATVHVVDEEYDHGPVIAQCDVPVLPGDTVESLRARVMAAEPVLFVDTLQAIEKRDGVLLQA